MFLGHHQRVPALLPGAQGAPGQTQATQAGDRGHPGLWADVVPSPRLPDHLPRVPGRHVASEPCHVSHVRQPVLFRLPVSLAPGPELRGGGRETGQQRAHQTLPGERGHYDSSHH